MTQRCTRAIDLYRRSIHFTASLIRVLRFLRIPFPVLQDVFTKAQKGIQGFENRSSPKTWLMTIARHTIADFYREKRRNERGLKKLTAERALQLDSTSSIPDRLDMEQALRLFSKRDREVFVLRYVIGFSIKECAVALGWSEVRVRVNLHHSRRAKRAFRYGGRVGTVIGGLVATCLTVLGIFYPSANTQQQFTEGTGTTVGTSGPSFVVAHLNILYTIISMALFALCIWRMILLFIPTHGNRSLWSLTVKLGSKRRLLAIALFALGLAVSSLELVDQYQGGPLGREYSQGAIEGLTMRTGHSMLLIPIPLVDRTPLPIPVISVNATSDVSGLTIRGGITKNPPALGGILPPTAAEEQFIPGTVTIPSESRNVSRDHFVPVFKITGTKPGYYSIHGFTIIYRWGPIVYRTKLLPVVVWHVTVN